MKLALILCLAPLALLSQTRPAPERLKEKVAELLKADEDNPPSSEGVLFAGGDTIAGWDTRHSFGRYRTVRRGIPGATLADMTYWADQLICPLKPSSVVIEGGDTALGAGLPPKAVADDLAGFIAKIHEALPRTRLVVIAARPDASKPAAFQAAKAANEAMKALIAADKMVIFVEPDALSGGDGKPDPATLADGKLQLNKLGYELLTQSCNKPLVRSESRYWSGTDPIGQ